MADVRRVDITDPGFKADPYPGYAELRQEEPVYRMELQDGRVLWLVTGFEEVERVFTDRRFVKDIRRHALSEDELGQLPPTPEAMRPFMKNLLFVDPPDHTRLRKLVQQAFTPKFVEQLRGRIQEIADSLLDDVEERAAGGGTREMDLIDDYAFPLPITVIAEMLGVPASDRQKFSRWSNAVIETDASPEYAEELGVQMQEFADYLRELFEKKRAEPADDLTTRLVRAEEEGEKLDEDELLAMIFVLIVAGHETTVNLIGNGTLALLHHLDQLAKLKADPSLVESAVEELLRYDGPVETSTMRYAAEEVELGGRVIPRGEIVLAVIAGADCDPRRFARSNHLDITRTHNRHLAFGKGIHYCLGAPLARLEGQVSLGTLVGRMPNLELNAQPGTLVWRPGLIIRGLRALPVKF